MTTHASDDLYDRVHAAAAVVRARLGGRTPAVGLILGSGLGGFADRLADPVRIDYGELPGFPVSKVHGHAGRLVIGERGGATCVAMQGRVHLYEGHRAADVAFHRLGACSVDQYLLVTILCHSDLFDGRDNVGGR